MDDLLPSFYRECNFKKLSKNAIINYQKAFKCYRRFYSELTIDNYLEWSDWLKDNYAPSSANLYLMLLRAFANWAYEEGEISFKLPSVQITPRPRKPQVIDDQILAKLIEATKRLDRPMAVRAELIIRLLLDTGIRKSELVGIKVKDIDFDDMSIQVTGKGEKPRFVYFGYRTARCLDRYLRIRKTFKHAHSDFLLLGQQGAIGGNGVRQIIFRICDLAKVPRINLHAFRHTFAHDWLASGGSDRDLMRVAGWSSDAMLSVYGSERADERAAGSHRRLSRGDRV